MERPAKRQKPDDYADRGANDDGQSRATPSSLTRSISPPSRSKKTRTFRPLDEEETSSRAAEAHHDGEDETSLEGEGERLALASSGIVSKATTLKEAAKEGEKVSPVPLPQQQQQILKSPFQLTKIVDYPPEYNVDTVTLKDLLGDPLISECWEFNYLHDIDFLMNAFDSDVRHLVKIHVVHGFWKQEDPNRLALQEAAARYQNVSLHSAFMPEMFGTHHSKMMILLRHDDTAQIIIHTANMIVRDWTNMTQAVWRSPLLPLLTPAQQQGEAALDSVDRRILKPGTGEKFKVDFLNYLASYNKRRPTCRSIIEELQKYDFSAIRGCLIASVPGRHGVHDGDSPTRWGWAAVKQALKSVPVHPGKAEVAIQISSIATLGPTDNWLRNTLFDAFSGGKVIQTQPAITADTSKKASKGMMGLGQQGGNNNCISKPEFKIIFPTADEIRISLDGYNSGGSIHTKISSAQQKKQLQYLKPIFYHWGNGTKNEANPATNAGRDRAAPHIKTYIRFHNSDNSTDQGENKTIDIDWALLTSANLSKQAWGEAASSTAGNGEMRIASYEIGVLVWPALFAEGAVMRGSFLKDTPPPSPSPLPSPFLVSPPLSSFMTSGKEQRDQPEKQTQNQPVAAVVVGLRMPYSLPLRKYGKDEIPWVATASYTEPDWRGHYWSH